MALLATTQDVQNTTGVSVSTDTIRRAQTVIDLVCGKDLADLAKVEERDQARLKLAVVYQAAWMDGHPEVFSTMDVESVDQEDLVVRFREDREANLVAPLARMALKRLSWRRRGMTSIKTNSVFQQRSTVENWKPLR